MAVSIDTGVNGVEARRPCRLSVRGRIDSLLYGVRCVKVSLVSIVAVSSVSERVERVECVKCVECTSRHAPKRECRVARWMTLPGDFA